MRQMIWNMHVRQVRTNATLEQVRAVVAVLVVLAQQVPPLRIAYFLMEMPQLPQQTMQTKLRVR